MSNDVMDLEQLISDAMTEATPSVLYDTKDNEDELRKILNNNELKLKGAGSIDIQADALV